MLELSDDQVKKPISEKLIDRRAATQVLGCLLKEPSLLDSYSFEPGDFGTPFFEVVYGAIYNLYSQGMVEFNGLVVDTYCKDFPRQKTIFDENKGVEYVDTSMALAKLNNFKTYVGIVKKLACLRKLNERGLNVKVLYDYEVTDPKEAEKETKKLNEYTVDSLLDKVEIKLITELREKYAEDVRHEEFMAGDHLEDLKEEWKKTPDFGLPFHEQKILTTIVRGARLGTVSIYSGGTGAGKTRLGYGRMCGLSIPWYYDWEVDDYIYHEGFDNPTLIMQTELTKKENQSLPLAYVSGVDEAIIRTGKYESKHQEEVVDKAIDYIKQSPLYFDVLTDFTVTDIINTIRKYNRLYGCKYFFFDYLQLSQAIVAEMTEGSHGMRSREDIVMLFTITRLKNLANELGIYLYTSTQLNNSYKDAGTFVDQSALRSAKSLADKIDVGDIMLSPSDAEIKATKDYCRKGHVIMPNIVNHIYKCRGTKFSKLKLFQKADLGTCRAYDLFCTNTANVLIDVPVWDVQLEKKPGKRFDKKIETIIDKNSIGIDEANATDVYNALNPEGATDTLDAIAEILDPETNTESHNALRDMGF